MSANSASGICAGHGGHQHAAELGQVLAELAGIADVDRVAFSALDRGGNDLAPHGGLDHHLGLLDRQAVAGEVLPLEREVQEITAGSPFGKDAARAGHGAEDRLQARSKAFDLLDVGPQNLDAHRGPHARGEHVDAGLDGHGPGVGHARKPHGPVHAGNQLIRADAVGPDAPQGNPQEGGKVGVPAILLPPLVGGLEHDRSFHHREGRGSVEVSARPALPNTRSTSGKACNCLSIVCRSRCASATEMPGTVVGM